MRLPIIALALALGASACSPAKPPPAAPAEMTQEEIDAASHDGPTGWLEADGPGETALVWRAGPNAIEFRLACEMAGKTLIAQAESVALTDKPLAPNTAAALLIGAKSFAGVVSPDDGLMTMSMKLPVTPDVLAALADAPSARIVVGDAFVEAGPDGAAKLAAFGQSCAAITGVTPAP
jgi:hypothetical protein